MKSIVAKLSIFSILSLLLALGILFLWSSNVSFHDPDFINASMPYIFLMTALAAVGVLTGITAMMMYVKGPASHDNKLGES